MSIASTIILFLVFVGIVSIAVVLRLLFSILPEVASKIFKKRDKNEDKDGYVLDDLQDEDFDEEDSK